ncbi:MAG: RDD family protein [Dethiobacter sp.]|nr:RDD family protein [Dethiobacter sp.]
MPDLPKADLVRRFVAALIDGVIAAILSSVIPFIGYLLGAAYTLTKEAIVFELLKNDNFKNKSIGKKLMNLEVILEEGEGSIGWMVSIRRNIPLAIGTVIMVIPVIGWLAGAIVGSILGIIEVVLVLTQPDGRRLGDKIGHTRVIDSASVITVTQQEE